MDFIRIAGAAAEGVLMASGPVMDPEDQPDSALDQEAGTGARQGLRGKNTAPTAAASSPGIPTTRSWCSNASFPSR